MFWPPDVKNWLIRKDPDAEKDYRQEEKGTTEAEMVGWYHRLDGHEFEQAPGVGDGQQSLVWYSPRGLKQSDMTSWLNWTELRYGHPLLTWTVALANKSLSRIHRELFSLCLSILLSILIWFSKILSSDLGQNDSNAKHFNFAFWWS